RLEFNPYLAHSTLLKPKHVMEFHISSGLYMSDVSLDALKQLDKILSSLPDKCSAYLALRPGDTSDDNPCLVIHDAREGHRPLEPLSNNSNIPLLHGRTALKHMIDGVLEDLFVKTRPQSRVSAELNDFLRRFRESLIVVAQNEPYVKLEA